MLLFTLVSGERVNLDHVVTVVTHEGRLELNLDNGTTKTLVDPDSIARLEVILAGKVA